MLGFGSHTIRMRPVFHLCFCAKTVPGTSPQCYRNASGVILGCIKNGPYHESASCHHPHHLDQQEEQQLQEAIRFAPPDPLEPLPLLESQVLGSFYKHQTPDPEPQEPQEPQFELTSQAFGNFYKHQTPAPEHQEPQEPAPELTSQVFGNFYKHQTPHADHTLHHRHTDITAALDFHH